MHRLALALDRTLAGIEAVARWLVIPIFLLLCLQWPLRDAIQRYSREANDLGQCLFALYAAVAVTAATRAGGHLAVDMLARRYSPTARRRIAAACGLLVMLPFAVFLIVAGRPGIVASVLGAERFPDSGNPGYFLIKLAVWVLAGTMILAAVARAFARPPPHEGA